MADSANESLPVSPSESNARTIGIVAICFAAIAAVWSLIGGACCGWAGWGFGFVGLVLSAVSLFFHRTRIGWIALGLSIFAFVWVFISAVAIGGAGAGAGSFGGDTLGTGVDTLNSTP